MQKVWDVCLNFPQGLFSWKALLYTLRMPTLELLGLFMALHDIGSCLRVVHGDAVRELRHSSWSIVLVPVPLGSVHWGISWAAALALSSLCAAIDYIWNFSETCCHWQFGIFLVTLINLFHIQCGKWINQNLKLFSILFKKENVLKYCILFLCLTLHIF